MDLQLFIQLVTLAVLVVVLYLTHQNHELLKSTPCKHDWVERSVGQTARQYHGGGPARVVADVHTLQCKNCGDIKQSTIRYDE